MATTFTSPALERKADLICVGRVTDVKDAYISKTRVENGIEKGGKYYVVPIQLEALDAGRSQKLYFLFRPEWLRVLSTADLVRLKEVDKGAHFVYGRNIATSEDNKQSTLQGLTVTTESFNELASRLIALGPDAADADPTKVSDILRQYLVEENGDTLIGYVLTQQMEKTGEVDENGKNIYVPTKNLEVASYFTPDEKGIARMTKKAEKNPSRFRMTYAGCSF